MIHVDVTKFANIPDGGGHRFLVPKQRRSNAAATARRKGQRGRGSRSRIGTPFAHTVIDDYSRMAYAEICTDERVATSIAVLQRAVAWFTEHGVTIERALSGNGSFYRSTPGETRAPDW